MRSYNRKGKKKFCKGKSTKNMTFDFFLKVGMGPRMAIWAHLPLFKWQLSAVWVSFCLDGSCTSLTNDLTPVSTPGNFSLG